MSEYKKQEIKKRTTKKRTTFTRPPFYLSNEIKLQAIQAANLKYESLVDESVAFKTRGAMRDAVYAALDAVFSPTHLRIAAKETVPPARYPNPWRERDARLAATANIDKAIVAGMR